MTLRTAVLEEFLDSLEAAFAVADGDVQVSTVRDKLFASLARSAPAGSVNAARLDVCRHLPEALKPAQSASPQLVRLASAFAAIEPSLRWMPRSSSGPHASDNWPDGHANAMIVGPTGLEDRNDVAVGVFLLAPNVRYPDHQHAPEEIYLVLTAGRFQHGESDWFAPGPGGTLHNVPNIRHAMASGDSPLLAFWCLLLREQNSA